MVWPKGNFRASLIKCNRVEKDSRLFLCQKVESGAHNFAHFRELKIWSLKWYSLFLYSRSGFDEEG